MPHDEDPTEQNRPDPQFRQTAVSNVTARDIQIGQIVQKIVHLGLPFNNQHLRFVQFLANSAYLTCLIGGFIRLRRDGADATTLLLLILGSGLLSLTCLYYAWFWKPELQDKNAPSSARQRSRKRTRRLALVGIFAILLLTWGGFLGWRSLPPPKVLVLVANFDGAEQQKYRITEKFQQNLEEATRRDPDVKVDYLGRTITGQQGSDVARAEGEKKKATIVIWGWYGVPKSLNIVVKFELLRSPTYFPKQTDEPTEDIQTLTDGQTLSTAKLDSFELPTDLNRTSYFTLFTTGMVRYAAADLDRAIERFNDALAQVEPEATGSALNQGVVHFYRGTSYVYKGNYEKAIIDFTQAITFKKDFTEAYNNRGIAYQDLGKHAQALEDFTQAITFKKDFAEAYNNRGIAYRNQGKDDQAIADYNKAITFKKDFAEAYNNRGNAYVFQNKPTQAIEDLTQAINLNSKYAEAYSNRGGAHNIQGNYNQAIEDFTQAINLNSKHANAYYGRGNAQFKLGKYTQAIKDYTKALSLKPDFAVAYYNRGLAYASQSDHSQAIEDFTTFLSLKPNLADIYSNIPPPDLADVYNNRGLAYDSQSDYSRAIEDYTQAINIRKDFDKAYNNRGIAYYHQGNYTQAIVDYSQAIQLKSDYAIAYYNKAIAHSSKREVKAAIESLQQAIHLDAKLRENAKTDSDFDNIRQDQRFQALVGQ